MNTLLRRLLRAHSLSLDLEQAILRIFVTVALIIYLWSSSVLSDLDSVVFVSTYLALALAFLAVVVITDASPHRRILGMISDLGGATYILANFGEVGAPAVFVYFWVTIGNGFRWGIQYLYLAMSLSILGMSIVLFFSPYWQANLYLYVGITLSLLIVPLFVSRLLKRLNELLEREQVANQHKSQFLANMSHELRTPLYGVIGTTDLLLASDLSSLQRKHVRIINASADSLLGMVNDILDISKIEAGKYQRHDEPLDLPALVRNTMQVVAHEAATKNLEMTLSIDSKAPPVICADPSAIRQILLNLLSNATKFTNKGSVRLRVSSIASTENMPQFIRLDVTDTGIGIPRTMQSEIFEAFTQADKSITRQFGGTGLGMAISKHLATVLGGTIGFESKPSAGSNFWFTVPVNTQIDAGEVQPSAHYRILLIASDDDPAVETVTRTVAVDSRRYFVHLIQDLEQISECSDYDAVIAFDTLTAGLRASLFTKLTDSLRGQQDPPGLIWVSAEMPPQLPVTTACLLTRPINEQELLNALQWTVRPPVAGTIALTRRRRHRRVLIADDQESNRSILANILEHGGYEVRIAGDSLQAWQALETEHFDAAIIDYHMPGESGISIIKKYKRAHFESDMVFLILTADATLRAKSECELAGVAYLTKPVRGTVLLERLGSLMPDDAAVSLSIERLNELRTYFPNAAALQKTLIEFADDAESRLNWMRAALKKNETSVAQEHVHALKGSSEFIGAQQLAHVCRTLQEDAEALDEASIQALELELQRVRDDFSAISPT